MKLLRPYQSAAIKSLFGWFQSGNAGHPLVVAPVAAGKSLLIADFIRQVHEMTPRVRIVVLTHTKELLSQNAQELIEQYPTADFGFYCAGLGQKRLHNDITFASIQSICNKTASFNRAPQIIIVDECHLIPHDAETTYRRFIDACLELNPDCKVIGFTGTPFRSNSGRLDEGDGKLFDGIAYEIEMSYMVEEGYWARPFTPHTNTKLSIEGVAVRGGDYVQKQLEQAVDVDETTRAAVAEIIQHGETRNKWLIFTVGVQHCEHVRDALRACGIAAEMVTGETPQAERDQIINNFRSGRFRALVNVAVLTTGFNVPEIDLLAFMRPTRSPVLYIQCAGRGVRPIYAPGFDLETKSGRLQAIAAGPKPDVMLLDFGNVIETLGPLDTVDIRRKPNAKKDPDAEPGRSPFKYCPSCGVECAASQKYCYECSYSFIQSSLTAKAANGEAVMSSDVKPETFSVWHVEYKVHFKKDNPEAPPSMRATYSTNGGSFSEWICFQHEGFARQKAEQWHKDRLPLFKVPSTITEAVTLPYPAPKEITVRKEGRFDRIINHVFSEDREPITPIDHAFAGAEVIDDILPDDEIPF